ncbi:hypothetical protein D3C86_1815660 [compost metagenome]
MLPTFGIGMKVEEIHELCLENMGRADDHNRVAQTSVGFIVVRKSRVDIFPANVLLDDVRAGAGDFIEELKGMEVALGVIVVHLGVPGSQGKARCLAG